MSHSANTNRSNFALYIAIVGILLMLAAGAYRTLGSHGPLAVLTASMSVIYVLWILSEFGITAGEASKDTATDQGTCETYAIARFLTMLAAFGFTPVWTGIGPWLPAGLALFCSGVGLRAWAIFALGRFYSHRVRQPGADAIVSSGPYRYLRHPAYTGMLIAHFGILVLFFNWFLLVSVFAIFLPALVRRIRVEEGVLLPIPAYALFAATRARLMPGVW